MVAVPLMSAGVALIGTFGGFVASWFLGGEEQADNTELREVRLELARLNDASEKASAGPR